ncbi:hypothetical protein [Nonomuraea sp. NEAU-A123]|uniref:hypothetical protein n=1 Tax=Nonomuraea sp. NEAU-A123 TaxID=2839649 RepID=UPI001BE3CFEE|nr:hypothetical protein [Nonomuraea sp. NEAU-A123]MBT2234672.1 hypothetical protein [Nonomuraea sp. NEAU-A123]
MNKTPYTNVTLCVSPGETTRLDVSFYTSKIHIYNLLLAERPVLDLTTTEAAVSISTTGGGSVTDADLAFARELFAATASDCERLHAIQADTVTYDGTSKATDQTAA